MLRKLLLVLLVAGLTACSSGGGEELPAGPDLMKKAAAAMRSVKSAAFSIATDGKPNVPVKKADGRLTAQGDADGTITLEVFGSLQEITFALIGDTVHFKGPTGGFQKLTRRELAQLYDPSLILDPAKGIAQLLESASDPLVQAEEGGAYRVATGFSEQTLGTLVPGVTQPVNGTVWVDKATSRLTKVELPLQGGSVSVTLADYDAPVTITPPPSAG
ncbi:MULTISPECIES: LppX_LprAFG lipoprotein [Nonomuraea]|uniref:LppX_LprAFG lipoprotein n=1 Tax=Nonomuraea ferruginea TaxID=46174 RepID=A0ABT4T3P2_9ACTN|nr:LppX_LprAFG lipoprotein [Nonomuraea ferruginea]MDA0644039.1 LppX_LprAFG lipoprotein [Nonomuraea ferruginea]